MALALADNTLFDSAETAATFHDSGGGLLGVVAAAHDVTELKKVEAELIEATFELERANLGEEPLPRKHEPRAAHPSQRTHRVHRNPARSRPSTTPAGATRRSATEARLNSRR